MPKTKQQELLPLLEEALAPTPARPFLKWAGSKTQLLQKYEPLFPATFKNYIEPFVGGGSVFLFLHAKGRLRGRVILNDSNEELINCYYVVQKHVEELIQKLWEHDAKKMDKKYYDGIRDLDRDGSIKRMTRVERAARTIFLNRTCYNGLYRVNALGQFNVPYGKHKNPRVCDEDNLRAVSRALQGVQLYVVDFEGCLQLARRGDFVYLDPPYHPLNSTSYFTNYTKENFEEDAQKRLARMVQVLDKRGCKVMLSNSDTELVRELYRSYELHELKASRVISSKASSRGGVSELVIVNY